MDLPLVHPPLPDPGRTPEPGESILLDSDYELVCRVCTCCKPPRTRYFILNAAGEPVSMGIDWRRFATAKGWVP